MKAVRVGLAGLALAGIYHFSSAFLPERAIAQAPDGEITVVELFTSQSCYSCPPAEAYLGELAARDDILALEYHVDYWNRINYGRHGRWNDPFSSPEMTARQRAYNVVLRGTGGVYTPQVVIDGRAEAVGSRRREVSNSITQVRGDDAGRVPVTVMAGEGDALEVSLGALAGKRADVWLVTFIREHTTEVPRGENHGKTLTNHNIDRAVRRIGGWDGTASKVGVSDVMLEEGQGCAVLVQDGQTGPVLGAAYCPAGLDDAAS
jgi:hypothetical protein